MSIHMYIYIFTTIFVSYLIKIMYQGLLLYTKSCTKQKMSTPERHPLCKDTFGIFFRLTGKREKTNITNTPSYVEKKKWNVAPFHFIFLRDDFMTVANCNRWGTEFSGHVPHWLADLKWPTQHDGQKPLPGVTWAEFAPIFMLRAQK